jgi:hypothetical protein
LKGVHVIITIEKNIIKDNFSKRKAKERANL